MQMPINDQMIVWEKYEVLFLNIVPWSQVSSISFSGAKNALIFSFFFFLIVHHITPPFFQFCLFNYFGSCSMVCGILIPLQGIKPVPPHPTPYSGKLES